MEYRFNTPLNGNIIIMRMLLSGVIKACINSYGYKVARWI